MSSGLDTLDRIDQWLARLDANQGLMLAEVRRLSTIVAELVATPCARCRLQLCDTLPAEPEETQQ